MAGRHRTASPAASLFLVRWCITPCWPPGAGRRDPGHPCCDRGRAGLAGRRGVCLGRCGGSPKRRCGSPRGPARVAPRFGGRLTSSPASGTPSTKRVSGLRPPFIPQARHLGGRRLASGDFRLRGIAIPASLARRGRYRLAVIAITRIPGSVPGRVCFTFHDDDPAWHPGRSSLGIAREGGRRGSGSNRARTFAAAGSRRPGTGWSAEDAAGPSAGCGGPATGGPGDCGLRRLRPASVIGQPELRTVPGGRAPHDPRPRPPAGGTWLIIACRAQLRLGGPGRRPAPPPGTSSTSRPVPPARVRHRPW